MGLLAWLGWAGVAAVAAGSLAAAAPQSGPPAQPGPVARGKIVDSSTVVAPVEVQAPNLPKVGAGAPFYTVDELTQAQAQGHRESMNYVQSRCLNGHIASGIDEGGPLTIRILYHNAYDAAARASDLAGKAAQASEAAAAARGAAAGDPSKAQASTDAELARQKAVNAYVAAQNDAVEASLEIRDMMDLLQRDRGDEPINRRLRIEGYRGEIAQRAVERNDNGGPSSAFPPKDLADLIIANAKAERRTDAKGGYVELTGLVFNPRSKAVAMPALSIGALDRAGLKLSSFVADPGGHNRIPPGKALAFTYAFRPVPERANGFTITFAGYIESTLNTNADFYCRETATAPPLLRAPGGR